MSQPCGYGCGKPWRPWNGTKLIGHVRCAIPVAEQGELLAELEADARTTMQALADRRGVPLTWIVAWVEHARKRRARSRR